MRHNELTNAAAPAQNEGTTRLAYEAPELTTYNQSQITKGGVKTDIADFIGGFTTSYKIS